MYKLADITIDEGLVGFYSHGCEKEVIMALTISTAANSGNGLNNLFSGMNGNNGMNAGTGAINLADYASIKNGSYGKLVKSYYKKSASSKEKTDSKDSVSDKEEKKVDTVATGLSSAASALADSKSLWEKKKVTDDEGNTTTDYDWDNISSKVKKFVDSYNTTLSKASYSESSVVQSSALSMVKATAAHSNALSSVGVSVNGDGLLSLDADKLKKSSISDLKSLFSGNGSYAYSVGSTASNIANAAAKSSAGYNAAGSYSPYGGGSMMDTYL